MMRKIAIVFIYIFGTLTVKAQISSTTLVGKVKSFEKVLESVHVFNLSSGLGTISDDLGNFEIDAAVQDSLLISSIQYKRKIFIIQQAHLEIGFIDIHLMPHVVTLEEMTLHQLSGSLTRDIKKSPVAHLNKFRFEWDPDDLNKEFSKDRIDRLKPPNAQDLTDPIKTVPGAGASATIPNFALEKEYKLKRKIKNQKELPEKLINRFGIHFFTQALVIPEDELYLFIDYCNYAEIQKLFEQNNMLALIAFFIEHAKNYHELQK